MKLIYHINLNSGIISFNWTKVELKHCKRYQGIKFWVSFNWTKVELKLYEIEKIIETQQSFNWTKVELKPIQKNKRQNDFGILLIELR